MKNGATAPTVQCEARVLVAHKDASMPAAGAEGTNDGDWKQVYALGGGITANARTRGVYEFGPGVAYLEVEFTGNTVQGVTVEALATTYAY
jgi:anaerobic selenocysteine-containing dehydrogenase